MDVNVSLGSAFLESGFPFGLYLWDVNYRETSKCLKSGQTTYRVRWSEKIYSWPGEKFVWDLEGVKYWPFLCSVGHSRAGTIVWMEPQVPDLLADLAGWGSHQICTALPSPAPPCLSPIHPAGHPRHHGWRSQGETDTILICCLSPPLPSFFRSWGLAC